MKRSLPHSSTWILVAITAMTFLSRAAWPEPAPSLESGWRSPPVTAKLRAYWWWLNGNVTKASITRDLEAMKDKGFGGALICDADGSDQDGNQRVPHGPDFFSPAWRELYRHALREADRLGLEMSLNIQSGWNLGGPMVPAADAAKKLVWAEAQVQGPRHFDGVLPAPERRDGLYRDLFVVAYPLLAGQAATAPGAAAPAAAAGDTAAGGGRRPIQNFPRFETCGTVTGPWLVHFDPAWGGPPAVEFPQLVSWTERPESGIRFYSGTATYETTIDIAESRADQPLWLLLGRVRELAEVRLNGKSLGVVWAPPFRVDLADAVHPGRNRLQVDVVNFWPNRVIGDQFLPVGKRCTQTNIRRLNKKTKLVESGLFGPVVLQTLAVSGRDEKPEATSATSRERAEGTAQE